MLPGGAAAGAEAGRREAIEGGCLMPVVCGGDGSRHLHKPLALYTILVMYKGVRWLWYVRTMGLPCVCNLNVWEAWGMYAGVAHGGGGGGGR